MDVLAGILVFLALVGLGVAVIMLIVKAAFKKGWEYKRTGAVAGVALVLFVAGMVMAGPSARDGFKAGQQAAKGDPAAPATQEQNNEESQAQLPESVEPEPTENEQEQAEQEQQNESGEPQPQKEENQPIEQPEETQLPKEADEADKTFEADSQELIGRTNGIVRSIKPYEEGSWSSVDVVVNDKWYQLDMVAKERFVNGFSYLVINLVEKIYNERPVVFFVDGFGKEVATPKMLGGYNIIE